MAAKPGNHTVYSQQKHFFAEHDFTLKKKSKFYALGAPGEK